MEKTPVDGKKREKRLEIMTMIKNEDKDRNDH